MEKNKTETTNLKPWDKKKIITVSGSCTCPYAEWDNEGGTCWLCDSKWIGWTGEKIWDENNLPEWCPLPTQGKFFNDCYEQLKLDFERQMDEDGK